MQSSVYSLSIIRSFEQLAIEADKLRDIIRDRSLRTVSSLHYAPDRTAKLFLSEAVSALNYSDLDATDEMDGRELIQRPGLVVLSDMDFQQVLVVNELKSEFSNAINNYQTSLNGTKSTLDSVRHILSAAGHPRVHLNQSKRKLVTFQSVPQSITWYLEKGGWGKQKTFSKAQAIDLLDRAIKSGKAQDRLSIERVRLQTFPENEVLVRRHKSNESIRVKVTGNDGLVSTHIASMPIFIRGESDVNLNIALKFNLDIERKHISKKRSKFETESFISSLSLYRYKEQFRTAAWDKFKVANISN